jgi:hypothetical protein
MLSGMEDGGTRLLCCKSMCGSEVEAGEEGESAAVRAVHGIWIMGRERGRIFFNEMFFLPCVQQLSK